MTCDEFRRLSLIDPTHCTRAERVAHYRHLGVCLDCQAWFFALAARVGDAELTKAEETELKQLSEGDYRDPEALGGS